MNQILQSIKNYEDQNRFMRKLKSYADRDIHWQPTAAQKAAALQILTEEACREAYLDSINDVDGSQGAQLLQEAIDDPDSWYNMPAFKADV